MPNYKVAVTLCVLLLLTSALYGSASAQSEKMEKKMEVGAQISGLAGDLGRGGRLTYNLNKFFALEGELNYLSYNRSSNGRAFQGQFGVKSGLRFNKFGIFGKLRPGFVHTRQDTFIILSARCVPAPETVCIQPSIPVAFPNSDSHTGFSLDVGGVAELYPSKRIVLRLDLGDTIINQRYPNFVSITGISTGQLPPNFTVIQPDFRVVTQPGFRVTTHNTQLSVGVGVRF